MVSILRDFLLKKRSSRSYDEKRKYHSIFMPASGLQSDLPSTMIPEAKTPRSIDVTFRDGVIMKSSGTSAFAGTDTAPFADTIVHIDQFYKSDDTDRLMLHTTNNVFVYNTTSSLFECYTEGTTVEDCEDAWNESVAAGVTATADNTDGYVRRGTYSAKFVVADSVSAGTILATEAIGSADLTGYTHIHAYIYSTVALTSGDLQFLLDNTASCASPLESLDIPAVAANTWTEIELTLVTPAGLGAVISVGLKMVVDKGAFTVYLDDIRATIPHTGTEDDNYTVEIMNDLYIYSNHKDKIKKWDMAAAEVEDLVGATAYRCKALLKYGERLNMYGMVESGTEYPRRVRWSKSGDSENYTDASAGGVDLNTQLSSDFIQTALKIGDGVAIYAERNIVIQEYRGAFSDPFSFRNRIAGIGIPSRRVVADLGDTHVFMAWDDFYEYAGGRDIRDIGKPIKKELFDSVNPQYMNRAFAVVVEEDDEVQFYVPAGTSTTPDTCWVYNFRERTWAKRARGYSGYGFYFAKASKTWDGMVGNTWASIRGRWNSRTLLALDPFTLYGSTDGVISQRDPLKVDLNGVAVDAIFETKDLVVGERYLSRSTSWMGMVVEARGSGFDLYYSTDYGYTYTLIQSGVSLSDDWAKVEIDYEIYSPQVRYKFQNNTLNETFELRWFAFGYLESTDR